MPCHDAASLEAFLQDDLAGEQFDTIRQHTVDCSECRARLNSIAENLQMVGVMRSLFSHGPPDEAEHIPLPETIGDYKIVQEIGRGGMGIVYEAEQQNPRRAVALKVLPGGGRFDRDRIKLFRREAQALARLRHSAVAAIHDAGHTSDEQHYLVMELAQGVPLDEYARKAALTRAQRLELFMQICEAINYAHQRGVIHLDIKPANILVDGEGNPKILDFGLARIMDPDAAMTTSVADIGKLRGTLPYMAPEQLRGDPSELDVRSDVYALGVILYELLTGQRPHDIDRKMGHGAIQHLLEESPQRPSSVNRTLRGDLETIMLKALEKAPSRRYQSTLALAEDIERYQTGQAILARPASGLYQFRKLVTRHKAPFAAAAMFVLLVSGFGIWMSALYARAQQAEQLARTRLEEAKQSRADVEVVSNHQTNMLRSIDAHQLGYQLLVDLRQRIERRLREAELSPSAVEEILTTIDNPLAQINRADLGSEVIHRNILSPASDTIIRDLADRPLIQARLRATIGDIYKQLGDYERAEPHLTAAWETARGELGDDDQFTLRHAVNLANLYREQGRYGDAGSLLVDAVKRFRRVLAKEHPDTLEAVCSLAQLFRKEGRYDEAEPLNVELLRLYRQVLGENDPKTLNVMSSLASLYSIQGRHDEAEALYIETIDWNRQVFGDETEPTLRSINNLAMLYQTLARYDEAEQLLTEILEIRRRSRGEEHPGTLICLNNLAQVFRLRGQYDEAEWRYEKALQHAESVFGELHPETLMMMQNLGDVYNAQGRFDEAEPFYLKTLAAGRRTLSKDHRLQAVFAHNLANAYRARGRLADAEPLFIEALENFRRRFGDKHPETVTVMHNMAIMYANQGRYEDAEAMSAAAVAGARASLPEGHPYVGIYLGLLGRLRIQLTRYAEAEAALLESHQILEASLGETHANTIGMIRSLADLYDTWDKPEQAAKYRALVPPDTKTPPNTAVAPTSTGQAAKAPD